MLPEPQLNAAFMPQSVSAAPKMRRPSGIGVQEGRAAICRPASPGYRYTLARVGLAAPSLHLGKPFPLGRGFLAGDVKRAEDYP
ncbi:MAG: hypothetical protein E5V90_02425, partial [Mesorhizobium sp.]